MSMTYNESLDTLDIILGDSEDVTFTPEEKQRAMTQAWRDPYVVNPIWDSTQTFSSSVYRIAVPSGMTTVTGIYLSASNSTADNPDPIDSDLYRVEGGYIYFSSRAGAVIPTNYTLYIKGNYKVTISDTITDTNVEEYVLALAGYNTLKLLGHKKVNLFLKNDTSMGELIALKREFKADVMDYRAQLPRQFQGA